MSKPTPGAMRAAHEIVGDIYDATGSKFRRDKIAAIIDRETGVAELVEALRELIEALSSSSDTVVTLHAVGKIDNARALLARIDKEA